MLQCLRNDLRILRRLNYVMLVMSSILSVVPCFILGAEGLLFTAFILFSSIICALYSIKRTKKIEKYEIVISSNRGGAVFISLPQWFTSMIFVCSGVSIATLKSPFRIPIIVCVVIVMLFCGGTYLKMSESYLYEKIATFGDSIDDIFIFIDHYKGRKLVTLEIKNEKMLKSFIEKAKEKDKWSVMTSDEVSYSFVNSIRQREDFQWLERISHSGNLVLTGLERIADFEYTSKYLASALCLKETKTLIVTNDADVFSHNLGYEIHSSLVLRVM